jgi:Na+/glutamate symporter
MDKLVTGLILGGIVASIYGIKKHQEKNAEHDSLEIDTKTSPSKKRGILSRIFLGDK